MSSPQAPLSLINARPTVSRRRASISGTKILKTPQLPSNPPTSKPHSNPPSPVQQHAPSPTNSERPTPSLSQALTRARHLSTGTTLQALQVPASTTTTTIARHHSPATALPPPPSSQVTTQPPPPAIALPSAPSLFPNITLAATSATTTAIANLDLPSEPTRVRMRSNSVWDVRRPTILIAPPNSEELASRISPTPPAAPRFLSQLSPALQTAYRREEINQERSTFLHSHARLGCLDPTSPAFATGIRNLRIPELALTKPEDVELIGDGSLAALATRIAIRARQIPGKPLVIPIYGLMGSGKTTLLNLLKAAITTQGLTAQDISNDWFMHPRNVRYGKELATAPTPTVTVAPAATTARAETSVRVTPRPHQRHLPWLRTDLPLWGNFLTQLANGSPGQPLIIPQYNEKTGARGAPITQIIGNVVLIEGCVTNDMEMNTIIPTAQRFPIAIEVDQPTREGRLVARPTELQKRLLSTLPKLNSSLFPPNLELPQKTALQDLFLQQYRKIETATPHQSNEPVVNFVRRTTTAAIAAMDVTHILSPIATQYLNQNAPQIAAAIIDDGILTFDRHRVLTDHMMHQGPFTMSHHRDGSPLVAAIIKNNGLSPAESQCFTLRKG